MSLVLSELTHRLLPLMCPGSWEQLLPNLLRRAEPFVTGSYGSTEIFGYSTAVERLRHQIMKSGLVKMGKIAKTYITHLHGKNSFRSLCGYHLNDLWSFR